MSVSEQGTAPPPGTQEQGSAGQDPRHRGRRWALAAGSAVAAAALAAGLTVALHKAPGPSPLSAVTSALAQTSTRSYTFSIDTTTRSPKQELNSDLVSGAFDLKRHLGTESLTTQAAGKTKRAQSRFIGAYVYTSVFSASGFGKLWDKSPLAAAAAAAGMPTGDPYGFVSDQPFSPTELNVVLQSAGAAVHDTGSVSGPGWTGTAYTFTASIAAGRESVHGTVDVDRQGRVHRITTTTEERGRAGKAIFATVRDITFGAFGGPVRVTAPPASQVKYSSGTPYWGFYF
jgi:hypothetical protein